MNSTPSLIEYQDRPMEVDADELKVKVDELLDDLRLHLLECADNTEYTIPYSYIAATYSYLLKNRGTNLTSAGPGEHSNLGHWNIQHEQYEQRYGTGFTILH